MPDLLSESNEAAGEVQEAEEGGFEFIVAGGDASELFEFGEEPFDPIAGAVGVGVGGEVGVGPIRPGGKLGHDPASETSAAEVIAVEPFVADEFVNDGDTFSRLDEGRCEQRGVVSLAGRHGDGDGRVFVRHGYDDFGAQAAATAAEGLTGL